MPRVWIFGTRSACIFFLEMFSGFSDGVPDFLTGVSVFPGHNSRDARLSDVPCRSVNMEGFMKKVKGFSRHSRPCYLAFAFRHDTL